MSTLIYSAITPLDGSVADTEGTFYWAASDAETMPSSTTSSGQSPPIS